MPVTFGICPYSDGTIPRKVVPSSVSTFDQYGSLYGSILFAGPSVEPLKVR